MEGSVTSVHIKKRGINRPMKIEMSRARVYYIFL